MEAIPGADVSPPEKLLTAAEEVSAEVVSGRAVGPTARGHRCGEDTMQTPQDVERMRRLHGMGWSQRAIARELGCCPRTVRRYLRQVGWKPYGQPRRRRRLATVRFETPPGKQLQEEAFRHWGGVPQEVLIDNARALVLHHDPASGALVFHPRLVAFAKHWGFTLKACRPHRPRTKGKDERGVRYVKESGLAGHGFG